MGERVYRNQDFLRLLCKTTAPQRKALVRTATTDQIESICECALNVLRKNVPLTPSEIVKLRKNKRVIYKLADKRVPVSKKRKKLEQAGGFLPALLVPILSTVLGLVGDTVVRKLIK